MLNFSTIHNFLKFLAYLYDPGVKTVDQAISLIKDLGAQALNGSTDSILKVTHGDPSKEIDLVCNSNTELSYLDIISAIDQSSKDFIKVSNEF